MNSIAVILDAPKEIRVGEVALTEPGPADLVVAVKYSGISTGTERLFWSGTMPPFPGMGYPLIPGYESFGEVIEAGRDTGFRAGDFVFVPGAACFRDVRGLFGGASHMLITPAERVVRLDQAMQAEGALLALAATARHALAGPECAAPQLIVGHGVLGRLLARLTIAAGAPPPVVWEVNPTRREGAHGYEVIDPDQDQTASYDVIYDASGAPGLLDKLIGRVSKGGEIVLTGFYHDPVAFNYPPAFMKEMRLRIAAEWAPDDLTATRDLVEDGALSLAGLISHRSPFALAGAAYETAFDDPACLKMILEWENAA